MKNQYVVTFEEEERQIVLRALAGLAAQNEAYHHAARRVALLLDNVVCGQPELFTEFLHYSCCMRVPKVQAWEMPDRNNTLWIDPNQRMLEL